MQRVRQHDGHGVKVLALLKHLLIVGEQPGRARLDQFLLLFQHLG